MIEQIKIYNFACHYIIIYDVFYFALPQNVNGDLSEGAENSDRGEEEGIGSRTDSGNKHYERPCGTRGGAHRHKGLEYEDTRIRARRVG